MLSTPLGRAWRILATGFAFSVFGLGALLLSVTACPLIALTTPDKSEARRRIQYALHIGCRLFIWLMRWTGLITYELQGIEALSEPNPAPRGRMLLANHPTLIDVVFLLAWTPKAVCIIKQAIDENPFLRRAAEWSGYVSNATPEQLINDCVRTVQSGQSLIMFPAGTRTIPGQRHVFKRGAAWIAIRSGAEILPIQIRCEPIMLTKHTKWYQVPPSPGHFTITVGTALRPSEFWPAGTSPTQAAARLTQQLESLLDPVPTALTPTLPAYSMH
jgi:1-acyl-sn-glycerol-3-phosphate acyltransferase